MKLYSYTTDASRTIHHAVERAGRLVPLGDGDLLGLIAGGAPALDSARVRLSAAPETETLGFTDVRILPPLRPGKILCSGVNYHGHFAENPHAVLPKSPFFFPKLPNAVIGTGAAIVLPEGVAQTDYEVEFAVVIGRRLHSTDPAKIRESVFGYTILNDVSARDIQFVDNQITLGKNYDTFAPIGPCIVTTDEMPDISDVRLRAIVSGELLQDGSTSDWVYPLETLIAAVTRVMTLEPGDIVTTCTPAGVGYFRKPQRFLRDGDTCVLEIDGIGRLENPVVATRS